MPKVTTGRRVPSDDCLVTVNGENVAIHEGEWVEVDDLRSYREIEALTRFERLKVDALAAEEIGREVPPITDDMSPEQRAKLAEMQQVEMRRRMEERIRIGRLQDAAFEDLCRYLADRLFRWTWTDRRGRPYFDWNDEYTDDDGETRPCFRLDGNPDCLKALSIDELYYLLYVHGIQNPVALKNDASDSPTTSLDSTPDGATEASTPSSKGRSRTKAA